MGLTITRQKDASQTRGLSKGGNGTKPCEQEVFYWMHEKLGTTLHKWKRNGGMKWSEMNLIDNGSTNFFQEHFSLFRAFFRNIL